MDVSTNSWLENAFLHTYLPSFMSTTVRCPFIIIIVIIIIITIIDNDDYYHYVQTESVTSDNLNSKLWMYQHAAAIQSIIHRFIEYINKPPARFQQQHIEYIFVMEVQFLFEPA